MAAGQPYALRLNVAKACAIAGTDLKWIDRTHGEHEARPEIFGDVVLARKETPTSYHLAVVVDDALQGVTHVVRGQDIEPATPLHMLLQRLLGLPTPHYTHPELIRDAEGQKLSKSLASTSLRQLRADGATAADIRHRLGFA